MLFMDMKLLAVCVVLGYGTASAAVTCTTKANAAAETASADSCAKGCFAQYVMTTEDLASKMDCQSAYAKNGMAPSTDNECGAYQTNADEVAAACFCNTENCAKDKKSEMTGDLEISTKYLTKKADENVKCFMLEDGANDAVGTSTACNTAALSSCYIMSSNTTTTTGDSPGSTIKVTKGCVSGPFTVNSVKIENGKCTEVDMDGDTTTKVTYCLCNEADCNKDMETSKKSGAGQLAAAFGLVSVALVARLFAQ